MSRFEKNPQQYYILFLHLFPVVARVAGGREQVLVRRLSHVVERKRETN
jgi:hypothetical protein